MEYKITDYNKKFRSVTKTEKFFSLQDFQKEDQKLWLYEFKRHTRRKIKS